MKHSLIAIVITMVLTLMAVPAFSQSRYIKTVEADFEDVFLDLQDSIINIGLGIEYTGNVGQMLERTAEAVSGSDGNPALIYLQARYVLFCSSKLTHSAAGADPANLSMCPFVVYAYETTKNPGMVSVGYRNPDFGNLDKSDPLSVEVNAFLQKVIDDTVEGY